MITLSDLKWELRIGINDDSFDEDLTRIIERSENFIRSYCNNPNLDFSVEGGLDEVVLYLSVRSSNHETRGRAGLASTSQGISLSYLNDLPEDLKRVLNRYRRVRFV
jgi:hypothetical protein